MNIFESLENLEVSEECFDEIMGIVERYLGLNMEDRALKYAPDNKELQQKAYLYDRERVKEKERIDKEGTPREKEQLNRYRKSVTNPDNQSWHKYRTERDYSHDVHNDPDYQHYKKIAREGLKKKVSGTKRNTQFMRDAKRGKSYNLYKLGSNLKNREKNKKGKVSYNQNPLKDYNDMDYISQKAPGVSYTSAEWNDND